MLWVSVKVKDNEKQRAIRDKKIRPKRSQSRCSPENPVKSQEKAKQSSEITKGQTRSEKIWVVVQKGETIGVWKRIIIQDAACAAALLCYSYSPNTLIPVSLPGGTRHGEVVCCFLEPWRSFSPSLALSGACARQKVSRRHGMQRSSKNERSISCRCRLPLSCCLEGSVTVHIRNVGKLPVFLFVQAVKGLDLWFFSLPVRSDAP